MNNIKVKENLHYKDIPAIVAAQLQSNENILANCLIENAGVRDTRLGVGALAGIGLTFNDYADHFKIVVTNERLLLIGMARTVDIITGIREISYDEIKSLKIDKKNRNIILKLTDNKYFSLTTIDFSDDPSIIEKSKDVFNNIGIKIGADKLEKLNYFTLTEKIVLSLSFVAFFGLAVSNLLG